MFVQEPARNHLSLRVLSAVTFSFVLASAAALVRALPLALGAGAAVQVAVPFAQSLLLLAAETSLLFGIPVGAALAAHALIRRGEARTYASLGVAPQRLLLRAYREAAGFALLLALASALGGQQAEAPGRVLRQLVAEARQVCASSPAPVSVPVPLLQASWLCETGSAPLLAGKAPVGRGVLYTARDLALDADLRALVLREAHLRVGNVEASATELQLRGLPVFVRASSVAAWMRALAFTLAALASAAAAFLWLLRHPELGAERVRPLILGAVGPAACLLVSRYVEGQAVNRAPWVLLAPLTSVALTLGVGLLLWRLRAGRGPVTPK